MNPQENQRARVALVGGLGVVLVLIAAYMGITRPWQTKVRQAENAAPLTVTTTTETTETTATVEQPRPQRLIASAESRVEAALASRPAVVVSLYSRGAYIDTKSLAEAQAGASAAGMGFVSFNMLDDKQARTVANMLEKVDGAPHISSIAAPTSPNITSTPVVLIFKRPLKVAMQFDGLVDRDIIAQGALIAGGTPGGTLWQQQANAVCRGFNIDVQKAFATQNPVNREQAAVFFDQLGTKIDKLGAGLAKIRVPAADGADYDKLLSDIQLEAGAMHEMAAALRANDQTAFVAAFTKGQQVGGEIESLLQDFGLSRCLDEFTLAA